MFDRKDLDLICGKGIEIWKLEKQLKFFREGFPFIKLIKPATINDGILSLTDEIIAKYISLFEESLEDINIVKFVPASGAATRMFKHLFEYRDVLSTDPHRLDPPQNDNFNSVFYFLNHLPDIAFYPILSSSLKKAGMDIAELISEKSFGKITDHILSPGGLDYSNLPKALIGFHRYPGEIRTAAEEHLVEAAHYATSRERTARIHFTISPEHRNKMEDLISKVRGKYEERFSIRLEITFSVQNPSTDVIAVDLNNEPVRDASGSLLFRPGGHGALLDNLAGIDAGLIFIKNIDNVIPDRLKGPTIRYKKFIGGYLIHLQKKIYAFLNRAAENPLTEAELNDTEKFARENLFIPFPAGYGLFDAESKRKYLVSMFDRPIRVCGMVKNEGEPGGGPFWVYGQKGRTTLQIVESSQIDFGSEQQRKIFSSSTHFNPVDIVCSTKNYKGESFRLSDFVDESTGLISLKSSGGTTLKAQELPGLWNGAMSDWITVFIEVPAITFNPVKSVNDLLRKEHLA